MREDPLKAATKDALLIIVSVALLVNSALLLMWALMR